METNKSAEEKESLQKEAEGHVQKIIAFYASHDYPDVRKSMEIYAQLKVKEELQALKKEIETRCNIWVHESNECESISRDLTIEIIDKHILK